ncbi:MAG: hypothetical protein ABI586_01580 [Candidatus Nanopelagicales bacterium]
MRWIPAGIAMTFGALIIAPITPVSAGSDSTPPLLNVPPYGQLIVGQQLSTDDMGDIRAKLTWTASDEPGGSGLRDVRVWDRFTEDAAFQRTLVYRGLGLSTEVVVPSNSYFTCSGYRHQYFQVTARDQAGNTSTDKTDAVPRIVDQNGVYLPHEVDLSHRDFDVVKQGNWDTSTFSGWIDGTTWKTREAGASVAYTRSYAQGQPVGVVMPTGPDRGKADIYVDNQYRATVDTNNATNVHRILTYQTKMSAGTHTLKIVNRATVGHPKIDIDAIVYLTYGGGC